MFSAAEKCFVFQYMHIHKYRREREIDKERERGRVRETERKIVSEKGIYCKNGVHFGFE